MWKKIHIFESLALPVLKARLCTMDCKSMESYDNVSSDTYRKQNPAEIPTCCQNQPKYHTHGSYSWVPGTRVCWSAKLAFDSTMLLQDRENDFFNSPHFLSSFQWLFNSNLRNQLGAEKAERLIFLLRPFKKMGGEEEEIYYHFWQLSEIVTRKNYCCSIQQ